ncbi:MAG TPA: ABC transporter permease [Thermoplasmatales archaeon]|nr:ABC transporter permease [Thermoplasmatales archaeon]
MNLIDIKSVYSVAKKEFMDHIRNKWIVALIIIFIVMTISASYLAGGKTGSSEIFGGMEETVVTLVSISTILIPLISIMLGYATISAEAESGALSIVLSYPVKRSEVLMGKFLGLGMVIVASVLSGFGAGGIVIASTAGMSQSGAYLTFIGLTIILGLLYLSLSICFSSVCKKRTTSIGAGILIFFWSMIYGMIIFGILLATGVSYTDLFTGNATYPDWMWASLTFSPMDMNQMSVMFAFGIKQAFGFPVEPPEYMNLNLLVFIQLIWIAVPMLLAYHFFNKRDI